jgi:hypothetical protein
MAAEAEVVSDVLAENGVLLPLDSIEEVKTLGERLKTDKDFRESLV